MPLQKALRAGIPGEGGWTGVRSSAIYLVVVQLFRGCSLQSFSLCGLLSCLELL